MHVVHLAARGYTFRSTPSEYDIQLVVSSANYCRTDVNTPARFWRLRRRPRVSSKPMPLDIPRQARDSTKVFSSRVVQSLIGLVNGVAAGVSQKGTVILRSLQHPQIP